MIPLEVYVKITCQPFMTADVARRQMKIFATKALRHQGFTYNKKQNLLCTFVSSCLSGYFHGRPGLPKTFDEMKDFNTITFHREEIEHLVSFIIPVYKDYNGLQRTLRSIKQQKVTGYTIEIIVVNDGGSEKIKEVCIGEKVKMVDVIPNSGSYYARNRGLEYSSGEFIAFIDADVDVPMDWLAKAIEKMDSYLYLAGEVDIAADETRGITHQFEIYNSFPVKKYFETEHFGVTAGLLVRRRSIEKLGGFDQRLKSGGDREFGKRVYDSMGKPAQVYLDSPALIHPPRTLHQFLKKIRRIQKGEVLLHYFYPQRYPKPSFFKNLGLFLLSMLPPRPGRVQEYFPGEHRYPFLKKWMFLWMIKVYRRYYTLESWLFTRKKKIDFSKFKTTFFEF